MTYTRILAAAALVATVAGPALASDSLARSVGVTPGALSTVELTALKHALESDDRRLVAFILSGADDTLAPVATVDPSAPDARLSSLGSATSDQLAASVGVEAGRYSLAELTALKHAVETDDEATQRAIVGRVIE